MNSVCVLIPSYDEAKSIGGIIRSLRSQGLNDICVIDDGSSDGTAAIAEAEGATVLRHERNRGKGASLKEGFRRVLEKEFDAVLVMDGDGQHETASVKAFISEMESSGADIVAGDRMPDAVAMPYVRRKTNRIMSYLISRMCGQNIPDSQCGYRLIKRKVLEEITLDSSNFEVESELIIKACRKGFRVGTVPIRAVYQGHKSRINPIVDTLRFMAFIMKMGVKR